MYTKAFSKLEQAKCLRNHTMKAVMEKVLIHSQEITRRMKFFTEKIRTRKRSSDIMG